jgi:hypothetical protein
MNSRRRVNSDVGQLLSLSAMTPQRTHKIAAIFPSLLVAIVHFTLSVRLAPHANVIFQRWFDSGEVPTGTDAVIANVNGFLSRPIPALLFAGHPVYGLMREWWLATIANSVIWGLTLYATYLIASWLLNRISRRST